MSARIDDPSHLRVATTAALSAAIDRLDRGPDAALDALVRQAARAAAAPVAMLTLLTERHAHCQAAVGLLRDEAVRLHPLVARIVAHDHAQVVRDLGATPAGDGAQTLGLQVCAGVPVRVQGRPVGALCVLGDGALRVPDTVLHALHDLAIACAGLLQARIAALHAAPPAAPDSSDLLRQTLEGLAASVMISGPDGRILMANGRWHQEVGALLPPGCTRWDDAVRHLVHAGHYTQAVGREEAFIAWRLSLAEAAPQPHEVAWRGRWAVLNDRLLPDGTVVHLSIDVTERRREQSHARALDARFKAVLGAVPDLWFVMDDDGYYRYCSDPDHPALVQPFSQLIGRSMYDVMPTALSRLGREAIQRARATGRTQTLEYQLDVRGSAGWYEARVSPMPDGEMLFLVRDLTELHRLTAEARLNEERWDFALAGAGHGVWDWNADTGRTYFSPYWKQMLGLAAEEVGERWDEWSGRVHPEDLPRVMDALHRYQTGEAPSYEIDYRMRHRDGRELWIRDRARIVARRPDGSPLRMVGTQTDITHQRIVEAQLRDKQAAELASRSKSEFLSRMSHEMRTPLNAVIGFAQLLRLQGGARTDYVDHVLQASQHLLTLINDVLDLQQVEEGRLVLHPAPLDPGALAAACASLLQPLAQARGVTQLMPASASAPAIVRADEQRLRQVLLNIGSNAIKYNRPGGQVRWSVELGDGSRPAIVVEDTGSGMTADQQLRLFQPFERLGRESSVEGSGLGLLIARRLVEDMGGTLSLSSQPGIGTRVRIELPAEGPSRLRGPADMTATLPPRHDAPPRDAPSLRLLYLEDNRVNALLFTEALRQHTDIELQVAETGAELFELLEQQVPDVFVLDAHLPDCNGYDVLARLRATPATADKPAYMCSADASPDDIARALGAGFAGYWTKPLDLSLILADLRRLGAGRPDPA